MKISDLGPLGNLVANLLGVKSKEKVETSDQRPKKEVGTGDTIQFSSTAQDLQRLQKAAAAVPEVRIEKVEQLRQAVAGGTYQVNGELVAEKLLNEHLLDTTL